MSNELQLLEKTHELVLGELRVLYEAVRPGKAADNAAKLASWQQLLSLHVTQLKNAAVIESAKATLSGTSYMVEDVNVSGIETEMCEYCEGKGYIGFQLTIEHEEELITCTVCQGNGEVPV